MNQTIDNALGGYEESVATVGGWAMRAQDASVLDKASPDTLLEQVKELRPNVAESMSFKNAEIIDEEQYGECWLCAGEGAIAFKQYINHGNSPSNVAFVSGIGKQIGWHEQLWELAPQMADRIIADAERIERLRGLLWFAWKEFNTIRARDGAPEGICHDYWNVITEAFRNTLVDPTPWPPENAKQALIEREQKS